MTAAGIERGLREQGKDELAEQVSSADVIGPVHAEVFIAEGGMLRRMRLVMATLVDGRTVTTTVREDLSDFGVKPTVVVPDDSRVLDLSPLLEAKLNELGQAG